MAEVTRLLVAAEGNVTSSTYLLHILKHLDGVESAKNLVVLLKVFLVAARTTEHVTRRRNLYVSRPVIPPRRIAGNTDRNNTSLAQLIEISEITRINFHLFYCFVMQRYKKCLK